MGVKCVGSRHAEWPCAQQSASGATVLAEELERGGCEAEIEQASRAAVEREARERKRSA